MTGDEVIALARSQFGEESANTVSAASDLAFLNAALTELYGDLPPERMRSLVATTVVAISGLNRGAITNTWDNVLEVYVDERPAVLVEREVIKSSDMYGGLFTPSVPIYHVDSKFVWVRPADEGVCEVVHLDPPAELEVATLPNELSAFNAVFHPALADLVTSFMYAQEEDAIQAELYRNHYSNKLINATQATQAETA